MSVYIARKYAGGNTFVFHREGTVHVDSILTFIEKDGVPYGTIDYDLDYHHITQARIDQTDYSKSIMPASVVRLFRKHVIPMLENK